MCLNFLFSFSVNFYQSYQPWIDHYISILSSLLIIFDLVNIFSLFFVICLTKFRSIFLSFGVHQLLFLHLLSISLFTFCYLLLFSGVFYLSIWVIYSMKKYINFYYIFILIFSKLLSLSWLWVHFAEIFMILDV